MVRILLVVLFTFFFTPLANTQTISAHDLTRRTIERRAVEAVNWGMPAVNYDLDPRLGRSVGQACTGDWHHAKEMRAWPSRLEHGITEWSILAIICPRQHQRRRS